MAPSNAEKRGLTLEKLASYDDVITDALVDKVLPNLRKIATIWGAAIEEQLS
jgi:hypothetical protein|tara:strand:- start:6278 stop:6433 length:156 start_codon:yes stop_codon:yes gene_type:complete